MQSRLVLEQPKPPVEFKYRGLVLMLDSSFNFTNRYKKLAEILAEQKMDQATFEKLPAEEQNHWHGRSAVGTIVVDIHRFTWHKDTPDEYNFDFNAPSEIDFFETQGEELLGMNPELFDAVMSQAGLLKGTASDYEITLVGNSLAASGSGQPLVDLGSVSNG